MELEILESFFFFSLFYTREITFVSSCLLSLEVGKLYTFEHLGLSENTGQSKHLLLSY